MPEEARIASSRSWRWSIAPEGAAALAAWGLGGEHDPRLERGELLGRNEGREVRRFADGCGVRPTLYLKWFAASRARLFAREQRRLELLPRRGLPVAPLLASGRDDRGARLLVLGEVAGRPLDVWFEQASAAARRSLSAELGRALARMHEAGVVHGQLFAWHVVIDLDGAVRWLDVGDATLGARPPPTGPRARDLAALFATIPRAAWPLTERARLLRAYAPERARRRRLVAVIRAERVRLLRHARVPRDWLHREWRSPTQRLLVAEPWAGTGVHGGTPDVAEWLAPERAELVRHRDGRSNLRWSDAAGAGGSTWFGKRFDRAPWRGRAFAFREFLALRALAASGIPTPPIAAVARRERGASVLWTVGIEPGTSLREALPRLKPDEGARGERRRLLAEAATIARRLHGAGFLHRDLYLDHLLLAGRGASSRLVLIDATRVALFAKLPRRGRIKDLAALEFSARAAGASRSERWRALLRYTRGDRQLARRLARPAIRKADRIARHERRHRRAAPRA